jgi:two-component system cell cycle sensor histidine kinase/response regulator CckA
MPTREPVRALILEDAPEDAELMAATFRRLGCPLTFDVVDSPAQFQQRLDQADYDIILADYNLRTWTAMDALGILRERGKDIPLIVVTGTLGDEAAVECIKQGAADYVLKDRLHRLPVAVDQALRDKLQRQEAARLQERIRRAKKEWEQTVDTVPDPVLILDERSRVKRANRAAVQILRLEFSQLIGQPCYQVVHGRAEPPPECPLQQMRMTGKEARCDIEEPRLGKVFDVTATPLHNADEAVLECVEVLRDITERTRGEEARAHLASIVESSEDAIISKSCDGVIQSWNRGAEKLYGYTASEMIGQSIRVLAPPDRASEVASLLDRVSRGERVEHHETVRVRKDGRPTNVSVSISPVKDASGRVVGAATIARDITERKRAEEALRQSEERFRSFVENVPLGVYRTTPDGRVLMANPALLGMLGYDSFQELASRNLEHEGFEPADARSVFREQIEREGEVKGLEATWNKRDGSAVSVREYAKLIRTTDGRVLYYDGVVEDITVQRRLEQQLRQAQKMEAIGQLAGGVAHDFNNLLTIIAGYAQILLDRLGADNHLRGHVTEIAKAADRAAWLTRQLLAFGRRQMLSLQVLDLNAVAANMDKMLRRLIGEDIDLVTVCGGGLGRVKADRGQVEQVILNLALNARDAMPRGGKLTLETANVVLDETYARTHMGVTPGRYVMLAVSDAGCGMDAETQAHIFEPFFTTKEQGKGTGLGLATVYGIVKQSGGHIWVYSELGRSTTFKIYLPRVDGETEEPAAREKEPMVTAQGSETILLVEDEAEVRSLVRGVLESKGYTVLEARDGARALQLAAQHQGPIHLLLTDVVMPEMSGRELAERLETVHRGTKLLYMSGYTDNAIVHHGVLEPGTALLQKPFAPDALARKVREVLDGVPEKQD